MQPDHASESENRITTTLNLIAREIKLAHFSAIINPLSSKNISHGIAAEKRSYQKCPHRLNG